MQTGPWTPGNKPALTTEVIINPVIFPKYLGKRYTVHKHRPKNVELQPANFQGKRLVIDPSYLLPAPTTAPVDENPLHSTTITSQAAVADVPIYDPVSEGSVVRVSGPGWKQAPEKLYVVLADNTHKSNSVKLTELGGTQNGCWWPKVPRGYVTVVPLVDILK